MNSNSIAVWAIAPGSPTLPQQRWLNASPNERLRLAEALGEDGARAMAKSKGWKPLMDGTNSTLRQGFDQVYRSADGVVHVVEAKGGTSPLSHSYGHPQGSSEWAVKAAARAVLDATKTGKMQVHVVRTKHVLGEPTVAVMEQTVRGGKQAARMAGSMLDDAARAAGRSADDVARAAGRSADDVARAAGRAADDAARGAAEVGRSAGRAARVARGAAKVAVPVALAVDGGLRVRDL
ncbi:MAG: hypothetical protein RBS80_14550 [Thermoguttaceae bacterium]|nr:hypothetical protein [Thermoguttaceae bacterium]